MYNNGERFRCHFLSIFVTLIKSMTFLVLMIYSVFFSEDGIEDTMVLIQDIKDGKITTDNMQVLLIIIGIIIAFVAYMVISIIIWSRTYIAVADNAILFEKSFIGTKKKSISIINISNINLEQGFLQRLVGISTVKLDTNSRTTADKTDFQIILKNNKANEFKEAINRLIKEAKNELKGIETTINEKEDINIVTYKEDEATFSLEANKDEIIRHGLLNLNIISIVITIVLLGIIVFLIISACVQDAEISSMMNSASTVCIIFITCLGEIYSIIKGFIKFFNYKIKRVEDKIYISYGLFQKIEYTIPVDKINAVQLKQSLFGRVSKKYRVDIVNVGIGDDDKEKNSFLLLYDTKENILDKLSKLLPEYDIEPTLNYEKQPKVCIGLLAVERVMYMLTWIIAPAIAYILSKDIGRYTFILWAVLMVCAIINGIIDAFTQGISIEDKYIKIVSGLFERSFTWIAYDKVEILKINSNLISRKYGIVCGEIRILAATLKTVYTIPYMKSDNAHILRKKVLEQINN